MKTSKKMIDLVLDEIQKDIYVLYDFGVMPENIRISIPKYFIDILKTDFSVKYNETDKIYLFGCKVVEGYNNQICVFDFMANPNDTFNNPITLKHPIQSIKL